MNYGNILVKVYGNVYPANEHMYADLLPILSEFHDADMQELLSLDGDLLCISYEGIYFDLDSVLDILKKHLQSQTKGKIDYIDLEAWTLQRTLINGTTYTQSAAPLNNVLDYSGH